MSKPIANAGLDQSLLVGDEVQLDGSKSYDTNGFQLTYKWRFDSVPQGSQVKLSDPDSVSPTFIADVHGTYRLSLVVSDPVMTSDPATVSISTMNSPPLANAGGDQSVSLGTTAQLDGTNSLDVDGDSLTYTWSIVTAPIGSTATLSNPNDVKPSFKTDEPGAYLIRLIVNDGIVNSSPSTVTVTTENSRPIAQAGSNKSVYVGDMVTLDGGDSYDPDRDSLVYSWSFITRPEGSLATLSNPDNMTATFTPDVSGNYVGQLIVNDRVISSMPSTLEITVQDRMTTVPNVVGTTRLPAEAAITAAKLSVGTITLISSSSLPEGQVISQNPLAGASAVQGTVVDMVISTGASLPPDQMTEADPVDQTVVTTVAAATSFLYSGANPIQTGVAKNTIVATRAACIHGRVLDGEGQPLSGVTVTILNHTEFGQTLSRSDGGYDLAVNGGGYLTVRYFKEGYLFAHRTINVPWQDYVVLDDVMLVNKDFQVTSVDLTSSLPMQVAKGSVVNDADGERAAFVMIPQGTEVEVILADGSTQAVSHLNIRLTEYTVGENGPKRMPAALPATTGYTYCVELSADESIAKIAGRDVLFSQPVPFYVDNFLDMPVGLRVPTAYYDNDKAAWIPVNDGRVIKILSITDGRVDLDTDGDDTVDSPAALSALGIENEERMKLAALYGAGKSFWRVALDHFSTYDLNFGVSPAAGAVSPSQPPPKKDDKPDDPCTNNGSIIECQSQVLGESIEVKGTPFTLNYRSDRVPGRFAQNILEIPLSGESVPSPLKRIDLEISLAGRIFKKSFPSSPNQTYMFTWDGKDKFDRFLQGTQTVTVRIGYVYDGYYNYFPFPFPFLETLFGLASGEPLPAKIKARDDVIIWQEQKSNISSYNGFQAQQGLGGWSIEVHHKYDPLGKVLYRGDGSRQDGGQSVVMMIQSIAGNGTQGYSGDGGPATDASLGSPASMVMQADGSLYFADFWNNSIHRIGPDGIISTVAGDGKSYWYGNSNGEGGPVTVATLGNPIGIAAGNDGSLYIAEFFGARVRKVSPEGIITPVAGNGAYGYSGDGGLATDASLSYPTGVAIGPDGSLYIADSENNCIRRVGPDGIITTAAGNGSNGYSGDEGSAIEANLSYPAGVATGPDGSFYIVDRGNNRIRKVSPDGIIATVAGNGNDEHSGDGGLATDAGLHPTGIAVGNNGNLYIADGWNGYVRLVGSDGMIRTVAGGGNWSDKVETGPSTAVCLDLYVNNLELFNLYSGIAVGQDDVLYIGEAGRSLIRKVESPMPGFWNADIMVPSKDGREIYHFNPYGRHLRTLNAITGTVIYSFAYNGEGLLISIEDTDGNTTLIERDSQGDPLRIVSPFGVVTSLSLNGDGYLSSIVDEGGIGHSFTYTNLGLLTEYIDPNGNPHEFTYDNFGRLIKDQNPAGGFMELSRTDQEDRYTVDITTAEGRTTSHTIEKLPTGEQQRVSTFPDGTVNRAVIGTDGGTKVIFGDGTTTESFAGPDPRFGMQTPILKSLTTKTGGLTSVVSSTRTATLTDPSNPLGLTTLTDTITVNGKISNTVYDAATRTSTNTSAAGRQSTSTLDEKGRVIQTQIPGILALNSTYDENGRLAIITQGTGADEREISFSYNPQGYLQTMTDSLGRILSYEYDASGRVVKETLPDNRSVNYTYDAKGNLVSLTPPGRPAHMFKYTQVDQTSDYEPPDVGAGSGNTLYEYNLDKDLTRITRPDSQVIDFIYDITGHLDELSLPNGALTYTYNGTTGKLTGIADPDGGALSFTYSGALLTKTTWTGTVSGNVGYTYNNDFRVTSISVNATNSIANQYDVDNLLTQVGNLKLNHSSQNGLLTGTILGNVSDEFSYNAFGELAGHEVKINGATFFHTDFTYDKGGRIVNKVETQGTTVKEYDYGYDLAERLTEVKLDGSVLSSYTYDENGNRLSHTRGANTTTGVYDDQDRLLTYDNAAYSYSANGELASKTIGSDITTYKYDLMGNLREVTLPGGDAIEYVIDAFNRRVGKKVNGVLKQGFLYQDQLKPVVELNGNGAVVSRFVYATHVNVPDYMVKSGKTYRIVTDHLGSPRFVVNTADGSVVQQMEYDEFGNVLMDTNPGFQPFGFSGGLYDRDTGLVRYGARDYECSTGRWTAKDPIGFNGGDMNLFGYVQQNPIQRIDPTGTNVTSSSLKSSLLILLGKLANLGSAPVGPSVKGSNFCHQKAGEIVDKTTNDDLHLNFNNLNPSDTNAAGTVDKRQFEYIMKMADETNKAAGRVPK